MLGAVSGRAPRILPYGSWPSPIDSGRVGAGTLRLSQPQLCDGRVYWLEGRPAEQGRQVVMRAHPGGLPEPLTPSGKSVRTRVHEYGGGDFLARDGRLFAIDAADQRIHCVPLDAAGATTEFGTPGCRYADLELSPDGRWLLAVEERPREGVVQLLEEGFAPDEQADRRVHGGPEKAVHLYPLGHHEWWRGRLEDELQTAMGPAGLGILVGGALGSLYSGYLWEHAGPVSMYITAAAVALVSVLITWLYVKPVVVETA